MSKRILFFIPNGFVARYFLNPELLSELSGRGVKEVWIASEKPITYTPKFESGMKFHPLNYERKAPGTFEAIFQTIRAFSLPAYDPGSIIDLKYKNFFSKERHPLKRILFRAAIFLTRKSNLLRKLVIFLESQLFQDCIYRKWLEEHSIDLVVTGGIGFIYPEEAYLLRAAKAVKTPSLCVITSWDHPSTKGIGGAHADRYLVWSDQMKKEMVDYHGVAEKDVEAVGAMPFQGYSFSRESRASKDERKKILYASNSPVGFPYNYEIIESLAKHIQKKYETGVQLVVRPHPNHYHKQARNGMEIYSDLPKRFPFMTLNLPLLKPTSSNELSNHDNEELVRLIKESDIVINFFSTVQLDALICHKPVINIAFDSGNDIVYTQKPSAIKRFTHIQRLFKFKNLYIANSLDELLKLTDKILSNSHTIEVHSEAILKECGPLDGQAPRRIADQIARFAKTHE